MKWMVFAIVALKLPQKERERETWTDAVEQRVCEGFWFVTKERERVYDVISEVEEGLLSNKDNCMCFQL